MADKKITQLNNITGANLAEADEFVVVDITADETKAITFSELKTAFDTGTGFVRITGDTMTGNLSFGDNDKAIFGAGSDLQIYHDGSHSYIDDVTGSGEGSLYIKADQFYINNSNYNYLQTNSSGDIRFKYQSATKLATTSTGIDVTGANNSVTTKIENTTGANYLQITNGTANGYFGTTGSNTVSMMSIGTHPLTFGVDGGQEKMRIDSSGNLLVGKTVENTTTVGIQARADGLFTAVKASAESAIFGRNTNDGDIAKFRKDGTTVGSIGANGSYPYIGSHGTSGKGIKITDALLPATNSGAFNDANVNLGASNVRWKDLYLSGFTRYNTEVYVGDGASISGSYAANDLLLHTDNNPIVFRPNGTEAVRIDSLGNVGIGDSVPQDYLEINGSGRGLGGLTISNSSASHAALSFARSSTATARIKIHEPAALHTSSMKFETSNASGGSPNLITAMTIDENQNVGIGTSSPSTYDSRSNNLVVGDSGDSGITIFSGATSNARLQFAPSGSTGLDNGLIDYDNNNDSMSFATGGSERMRIDSSGNLLKRNNGNIEVGGFGNGTDYGVILTPADGSGYWHMYNDAGGHLAFGNSSTIGSTERMRIDSSGHFYLGKTSTSSAVAGIFMQSNGGIDATRSGARVLTLNRLSSDGSIIEFQIENTHVGSIGVSGGNNLYISGQATNHAGLTFATDSVLPARQGTNSDNITDLGQDNNRFKDLHLSGIANIGGTAKFASWSNSGASTGIEIRSTSGQILNSHTGTSAHAYQYFYNANGIVGSISASGSTTAYNTSSDYRLKENVVDLTGASARVNQLDVKRFNFIADDTNTAVDGFLAHEVATVVPEAITGTKDAMMDEEYEVTPAVLDDDGNVTTEAVMGTRSVPDYQGIDQSKLVPLLTAALQEALTEIASLKTRVEALEG